MAVVCLKLVCFWWLLVNAIFYAFRSLNYQLETAGGMEELSDFLKSRGVNSSYLNRMKNDKIDCNVLLIMNDEQMKSYIPSYGDRLAAIQFAKKRQRGTFETSLDRLKRKIDKKNNHLIGNKHARKDMKRLDIGWCHYDEVTMQYKQVRKPNGGGKRSLWVPLKAMPADIMNTALGLFFPEGNSKKGKADELSFSLKDFQGNDIPPSNTFEELITKYHLSQFSVYLYSISKRLHVGANSETLDLSDDIHVSHSNGTAIPVQTPSAMTINHGASVNQYTSDVSQPVQTPSAMTINHGASVNQYTCDVSLPVQTPSTMTINHGASVNQYTSDVSLPVQTPSAMTINHGAPANQYTSDVSQPVQTPSAMTINHGASVNQYTSVVSLPVQTPSAMTINHGASVNQYTSDVSQLVQTPSAMTINHGASVNHSNNDVSQPVQTPSVMTINHGASVNHSNNDVSQPVQTPSAMTINLGASTNQCTSDVSQPVQTPSAMTINHGASVNQCSSDVLLPVQTPSAMTINHGASVNQYTNDVSQPVQTPSTMTINHGASVNQYTSDVSQLVQIPSAMTINHGASVNHSNNDVSQPVQTPSVMTINHGASENHSTNDVSQPVQTPSAMTINHGASTNQCTSDVSQPVQTPSAMTINHGASVNQCSSDVSLPVQTPSAMTINHGASVNQYTNDVSQPVQTPSAMTINHGASVNQCTSDVSLPVQTPSTMTINHGASVNHCTSDVSQPLHTPSAMTINHGGPFDTENSDYMYVDADTPTSMGANDPWSVATLDSMDMIGRIYIMREYDINFEWKVITGYIDLIKWSNDKSYTIEAMMLCVTSQVGPCLIKPDAVELRCNETALVPIISIKQRWTPPGRDSFGPQGYGWVIKVSFRQRMLPSLNQESTSNEIEGDDDDDDCFELPVIRRQNRLSLSLRHHTSQTPSEADGDDEDIQEAIKRSLEDKETDLEPPSFDGLLKSWIIKTVTDGSQRILVHRGRVLTSTMWATSNPNFSFLRPVKIVFAGEIGEDSGGPKRELFRHLMREIEAEITVGRDFNKIFTHDINKLQKKLYEKAGRLVAWSILHGGCGLPVFNKQLYDIITTNNCHDVDLDAVDLDTKDVLEALLTSDSNSSFQNVLQSHFDWLLDHGMVAYGKAFCQKEEMAKELFKNAVFYRTHTEICQFLQGLNAVGNFYDVVKLNPILFRRLFVNETERLTFDKFRTMYTIDFSEQGSNNRKKEEDTIFCFEAFLMASEAGQQQISLPDVLAFWTGASSIPPLGFQNPLEIKFMHDEDRLPVAHTCGPTLELPRGASDPEQFASNMQKAITWSGGFHLA